MRLAVVVGRFPNLSETFIARELTVLRELGFTVTVYSLSRPRGDQASLLDEGGFEVVHRPPVIAHKPSLRETARLRALMDLFLSGEGPVSVERLLNLRHMSTALGWSDDMRQRSIEWVHGHFAYVPSMVALMSARLLDVPFSFAAHAWDLWCTHDDALLRQLCEHAAFATVCTEYGREFLLGRSGDEFASKVYRNYHGLDLSAYPYAERRPNHPLNVTAVGRLVPKKGFATLVEACRLMRADGPAGAFECRIVGDGPLRASLQCQIDSSGLRDQVRLMGAMSHANVIDALQASDVCVVPSVVARDGDRDGLPNVLLEAAALGVPIVASDVAGMPEFVEERITGHLVQPGDSRALAAAIRGLPDGAGSPAAMARAARAKVEEQFDLRRNVAALAELFRT